MSDRRRTTRHSTARLIDVTCKSVEDALALMDWCCLHNIGASRDHRVVRLALRDSVGDTELTVRGPAEQVGYATGGNADTAIFPAGDTT